MVEPGAPGQRPKALGVPKQDDTVKTYGVPKNQGVPKDQGRPKDQAILPGTAGRKRPGDPGQVPRGAEGQLDKTAPNPWAPTPDTVVTSEDALVPPSSPDRADPPPGG